MRSKVAASIRLLLLNDFSIYQEKIFGHLGRAGLNPKGYHPKNKADFIEILIEHEPDVILIAADISEETPKFHFKQVQTWLVEQKTTTPLWMVVKPEDEEKAVEAMYDGLLDYFFTDRLSRLVPLVVRLVGRHKLTFESVALNPIVEEVIAEYRPSFQAKGLALTFLPGVDLPVFLGASGSLVGAVSSILEKIIAAVPPTTKSDIRTYLDPVKGEVCLEIKLSGQGLQTEQQIEQTAVSEITLRTAAKIVETQNGRLDVDWGEESGIRIRVSFPAILEKQIVGSPRLLIVENSLLMRSILQEALEQEGFTVRSAENGADALEKMADFRPDLIISDIVMPKMDGFAFFEAVRGQSDGRDIPFIFVTGQSEQKEHLDTQVLRGATYLIKPIIIEELLVAVRSRL
jgi:CheY-like chemotaxis protein